MRATLIADASPGVRSWVAAGLQCAAGVVTEAESAWELLWHLSERPFDLVVTGTRLPDIAAPNLLAMVRTAGLDVPFLLILPFCSSRARGTVSRMPPAEIVEDWTDTADLRTKRDRLRIQAAAQRSTSGPLSDLKALVSDFFHLDVALRARR